MNKRRNPRHIMRILALALSIALVFSGMAVYYAAEGDGSTPAVVSDGDAQGPAGGNEGSGGEGGSGTVTTPSDTPAGGQGGSGNVTTPSDTPAGGEGGSGNVTTPSDTPAGGQGGSGTVTTPSDVPSSGDVNVDGFSKCPFCDIEYYSEEDETCYAHYCHEHSADYCSVCPDCGGCTDNLYDEWCYKDGKRCKGCTCFDLIYFSEPSHFYTEEEVADQLQEEVNLYPGDTVYVLMDGGKIVTLDEFVDDYGARITKRTVNMDSQYERAVFLNVPKLADTERARFSYAFRNEIKKGNVIPMEVSVTVEHEGVTRELKYEFCIFIDDEVNKIIKSVALVVGSEELELMTGEGTKLIYHVTIDEEYKDKFYVEALATNPDCVWFSYSASEPTIDVNIEASEVGKGSIILAFVVEDSDGEILEVETRTIKIEVLEPEAPAAPGGSVYFDETTIKSGESVRLHAKGWFDGKTLAESTLCYLPASWSVNPSGSWEIPDAGECPVSDEVMNSLLNQTTPELKNLAVKEHTGRVTFQGYERKADGWYPIDGDVYVGSAKLKVEAASGGSNPGGNSNPGGLIKPDNGNNGGNGGNGGGNGGATDGKGEGPGTGDIIRDNPGVRVAGIVMLIAGLLIFGTLAAERVYREMQDRKRQAAAVRR